MKHLKEGKKFHRKKDQREALLESLVNNLIINEKIQTTTAKAKEAKRKAERLITIAKKQDLASYRLLKQELPEKSLNKLYYELSHRYKDRNGGYTRIIKIATPRKGDNSDLSILELIK
ncbi:MAG TPA: 50S ribosomal protein L17 [Candidatus Paceibacterota bacterium]|jgi:large subunit ribosomal protein L17|nr:50S ribosomal protein L17 [Candidatus Paceibacterota bacterium]HOQ15313.1 50S ribosomal protein L17 [Candidatus Paceibacterota bacterium]HPQ22857.1 50S ribosomal protein L17 [Candidatus Paceibacterota bacterium]HRR45595.1 50S ribosomal protein L17 [Candidatus Paceibacterota bacterium]